ncbi:hypothetical protein [Rhizobium mesoamericanum]|uniref:hypothetical protein n=1 Tax=Rhizobium mesoamericanum TaxID=1079800 RepID=UPI00048E1542|nr:hypothetical protein [Rhizobium mesoamericanum]
MIPAFYRQACFAVSETAGIAEVSEDTLRTWMARNVTDYTGQRKDGRRLWFSAHDAYFFALLRDISAYGVSIRVAMYNAARLADDAIDIPPICDEVLVVRTEGDVSGFQLISRTEMVEVDKASLYIPLRQVWQRVMERAAATYASEAE